MVPKKYFFMPGHEGRYDLNKWAGTAVLGQSSSFGHLLLFILLFLLDNSNSLPASDIIAQSKVQSGSRQ